MANNSCIECPICMDEINMNTNCVTTECGHTFHCSCLFKNAAHNGFGCPYCRKVLAEELIEDEEDEDDDDYEEDEEDDDWFEAEEEPFNNRPLTSFRMFHQRLNGEEVEEEEEELIEEQEENDYDDAENPNAVYIGKRLEDRGINYDQLVKSLLHLEHNISLRGRPLVYERTSLEVYGQIRAIIHQYRRRQQNRNQVST